MTNNLWFAVRRSCWRFAAGAVKGGPKKLSGTWFLGLTALAGLRDSFLHFPPIGGNNKAWGPQAKPRLHSCSALSHVCGPESKII